MPISLHDLLLKQFPPDPYWIDEGILSHNSMLIVGGPPKSYKSFVLNTLISDVALGGSLFGASTSKHGRPNIRFACPGGARILLMEQEVGEIDLQNRFREFVLTMPNDDRSRLGSQVFIESCNHQLQLDTPDGYKRIHTIISDIKPDIVVFDPIVEFHTGNENDAQEMMRTLRAIDLLREQHRFTTVLSHHTKKPADQNGFNGADSSSPDRLRGSSVLYGKGDAFLMLNVVNESSRIVRVKPKLRRGRPIKPFIIQLNRDTLKFEFRGLSSPKHDAQLARNVEEDDDNE